MKIKRFIAQDMRQALLKVREEQGPDAVILSTRNLPEGAEVVAAVDYDETLMLGSPTVAPNPTVPNAPSAKGLKSTEPPAIRSGRPAVSPEPALRTNHRAGVSARDESENMAAMRRDLAEMRRIIEQQVGQLHEDRIRVDPVRGRLLDELIAAGIEPEHARSTIACIGTDKPLERARGHALGLLAKSLEVVSIDPLERGGVVALVGPTGAGKTTTLVKLAARYALTHSSRDVALVAADSQRVGACDQLQHYGRLLGMTVIESAGRARLQETLQRLDDYRLILVDCPGGVAADNSLTQQLSWIREKRPVSRVLALPAHLQPSDMDRVVDRYDGARDCMVALTKLDETSKLGGAISVAIRRRLALAYVTDGQRVPEDLQSVQAHRLVLQLGQQQRAVRTTQDQEQRHAVG